MKLVLVVVALILAAALGGWYASGRDLRTFRDGMTTAFRSAGAEALNVEDVTQLDAALDKAFKSVRTGADKATYRKLEFYAEQSAKAISEIEAARASLGDSKPDIAEMQLKQADFHSRNRRACLAEFHSLLPDPTGKRQPPSATEIGDAVCQQK